MNGGALDHGRVVIDLHLFDFIQRKLGTAIFTEQADRIGSTLATVTHHIHVAGTGILQRLQLLSIGTTLSHDAEVSAVLLLGDEWHDVMQEGALLFDDAADFFQMLVVDTGDHD